MHDCPYSTSSECLCQSLVFVVTCSMFPLSSVEHFTAGLGCPGRFDLLPFRLSAPYARNGEDTLPRLVGAFVSEDRQDHNSPPLSRQRKPFPGPQYDLAPSQSGRIGNPTEVRVPGRGGNSVSP